MPGGNKNIDGNVDGKQFSSTYKPAEKWTEKKALELGQELIEWLKATDDKGHDKGHILYEEFLVIEKELYPTLIAYLCEKFSSFSKLVGKAKKIQEVKLTKYGIADRLNASMTKFTLINNHGWADRNETDHSSTDGTMSPKTMQDWYDPDRNNPDKNKE